MDPKRPDISVVIPVRDEVESLLELCQRLEKVLGNITDSYEVIVIDDGSSDGSFEVIEEFRKSNTRFTALQLRRPQGKAAALAVGFHELTGHLVITMDGDLQDLPEDIPTIIAKLEEGFDLVSGWRVNRQDSFKKVLASRIYNSVTRCLTGNRLHDMNCGLKGYRGEVIDELGLHGELHRYIPVIVEWKGFRVAEIAVGHDPRRHGETKYGTERVLKGFFDLFTVVAVTRYLRRPLHLFGAFGLGLATVGVIINIYLTVGWLIGQWWLGARPLLLLGVLLMLVGIQFTLFGLLAEIVTYNNRTTNDISIRKRLT